ncbi:MAG: aspartate carbamoyltransferase [Bacteroidetes bacterium]|nr:aspartate carbamoyltransferase [Bacteroidota bacterium]
MKLAHVIESQQFTVPMLSELFRLSEEMERIVARGGTRDYSNKIMASLFYANSTRTRFSFESAMSRLGGKVLVTEHAQSFSSDVSGETLEDTIRVVGNYSDVIVLRHNEVGGAARAAKVSVVPVINAGDGKGGQHPTQALLDLYTIYKEIRTIDGVRVAMVGNLAEGRTVRSLAYLLGKFERVRLYFVASPELQMRQDIIDYLTHHNVWFAIENDLSKILPAVDVVYMTRSESSIQPEEAGGTTTERSRYYIDDSMMWLFPQKAIIMHPLPRSNEIAASVDSDPRAAYFRQTKNGIYVRMALLVSVLG